MGKRERKTDPSHVQSVERALLLLESLADLGEGATLNRLVTRSGLTSSTAHRLLTTMASAGFVQFDSRHNLWSVGRKAFQGGVAFARRENIAMAALPVMRAVRDEWNETINLGVRADDDILVLAQVESRHVVRAVSAVGGLTPMTNCALGKAILATFERQAVQRLLLRHRLQAYTSRSVLSKRVFLKDLEACRLQGYAMDDGEFVEDVRCVAAPVYDAFGEAVASLSISALAGRVHEARFQVLGQAITQACEQVTRILGGVSPPRHAQDA